MITFYFIDEKNKFSNLMSSFCTITEFSTRFTKLSYKIREVDLTLFNRCYFWGSWFYFKIQRCCPAKRRLRCTTCKVYQGRGIFFREFWVSGWWVFRGPRGGSFFWPGVARWFIAFFCARICVFRFTRGFKSFIDGFS